MTTTLRPLALLLAALGSGAAAAGVLAPDLQQDLAARAPAEEVAVIVQLADRANLAAIRETSRSARVKRTVAALKDKAARTLPPVVSEARRLGGRAVRELWLINGLAVTLPAGRVAQLAAHPAVGSVRADSLMLAPSPTEGVAALPQWNLAAVTAADLWALGFTGAGVVVANMDTGVDAQHPDLASRYRGGANSWFDPHGQHATPHDANGHGTQTMGIMVGGDASGLAIGMAPDARWIAVKQYDDGGQASFSHIHQGFQWLLDPDGNADSDDAPHVVNASWGLAGTAGQCITEFDEDIRILKGAGVAVAFAAGNDGPAAASSVSPGNNLQGFAVGAVDEALAVAGFSSRGPSACDFAIYPDLAAPGANVITADLSFGGLPLYMNVSGTSYAAPHVAGALALLAGAFPGAPVDQLEAALLDSARDLGAPGADNDAGHGLLDVRAAFDLLGGGAPPNTPPSITSTPVTTAAEGVPYRYDVAAEDAEGGTLAFALGLAPAGMVIDAASGVIDWIPAAGQAGSHGVTVLATDPGGLQASQSFSIGVAAANQLPVALNDAFSAPRRRTASYAARILPVLANDADPDTALDPANRIDPATVAIVAAPNKGGTASVITAGADAGSISYKPKKGFAGVETLTYRVRDTRGASSNTATVSITVK